MNHITFIRNGQTIFGYILSRDSDPTAAIWVIDSTNPDKDYFVNPSEVVA